MRSVPIVLITLGLLTACGTQSETTATTGAAAPAADDDSGADEVATTGAVGARLDELDGLVADWADAPDIATAHADAEAVANLIVGPNGPGYGDRDGDGTIMGANEQGLLDGIDGTPTGLADALADNECVARDVLAGTMTDPEAAWEQMTDVIAAWTPSDNTMPQLASHPMRMVGWATLTLSSDSLDEAHEYAGHADIHIKVSQDALNC